MEIQLGFYFSNSYDIRYNKNTLGVVRHDFLKEKPLLVVRYGSIHSS